MVNDKGKEEKKDIKVRTLLYCVSTVTESVESISSLYCMKKIAFQVYDFLFFIYGIMGHLLLSRQKTVEENLKMCPYRYRSLSVLLPVKR